MAAKVTSRSKTVKSNGKKSPRRRSTARSTGWMDKAKLVGGLFAVGTAMTMFGNWQAGKTINPFTSDYYK